MRFWAVIFLVVTLWLAFRKTEDPVSEDDLDMNVKKVYKVMWSIFQLKSQSFESCFSSCITLHCWFLEC